MNRFPAGYLTEKIKNTSGREGMTVSLTLPFIPVTPGETHPRTVSELNIRGGTNEGKILPLSVP